MNDIRCACKEKVTKMASADQSTCAHIKIEWFNRKSDLAEIYQKTGIIYSFVTAPDKDGKQKACHQWVKCRDFLHDAVRTQLTGENSDIYGFHFHKDENPPVDLNTMRMLVSKNDLCKSEVDPESITGFKAKMNNSLLLLNHFEQYAEVPNSEMIEVDTADSGKECVVMFNSPKLWLISPFLVSMYSFIIRLGDKEVRFKDKTSLKKALKTISNSSALEDNDITYLKTCWDKMHSVLDKRDVLFPLSKDGMHTLFSAKCGTVSFHNCGGIVSLCKGITFDTEFNAIIKRELNIK